MKQHGFMELFTCPQCGDQEFHYSSVSNKLCQECLVSPQDVKYEYLEELSAIDGRVFLRKKNISAGKLCFEFGKRIVKE